VASKVLARAASCTLAVKPIQVALVNDYEIVLAGLRALLKPSEVNSCPCSRPE
jgi:hypothetical protein